MGELLGCGVLGNDVWGGGCGGGGVGVRGVCRVVIGGSAFGRGIVRLG